MLQVRTAIVTGSSSGIGRAIALALAQAGADVVVHARNNIAGAEQVADDIRKTGRQATVLIADFADQTQQDAFCEQAWSWRNGVDVLVNNAGVDVLTGASSEKSFEQKMQSLFEVDVLAAMRISRNIGQRMLARSSVNHFTPNIIHIGWDQSLWGMAGDSGEMFAAIKAAVIGFSKSLAQSLAPGVRVNCIAPGWIQTAWGEDASAYWQQRAKAESLLGRWGSPDDVAQLAVFLASDAAGFINGQTIAVNGGFRRSPAETGKGKSD
jgi:3-oxoacyl-[acyl-carrier protein] reductase